MCFLRLCGNGMRSYAKHSVQIIFIGFFCFSPSYHHSHLQHAWQELIFDKNQCIQPSISYQHNDNAVAVAAVVVAIAFVVGLSETE